MNILLTTIHGLGLPPTLCLPAPRHLSEAQLSDLILDRLPLSLSRHVYVSTTDGRRLSGPTVPGFLENDSDHCLLLPLRLNVRLRGGKGGFGSQLRAAGGRMSSRKRKQNAELATGSARNLDGRRLRTITEAKNLATYLATKPDMDRKEKEERRKRWEAVVELAEQREADMRAGKTADGRRQGLSSEWIEEKEEVGENVKNAVKMALAANDEEVKKLKSDGSEHSAESSADEDSDGDDPMELDESEMTRLRTEAEAGDADAIWVLKNRLKIPKNLLPQPKKNATRLAGFDDDLSDSDSEDAAPSSSKDVL